MRRTAVKWFLLVVFFFVLLGLGLRVAVGSLLGSDEARAHISSTLEHSLNLLVPNAIAELKSAALVGLASIELEELTIRSGQHLDKVLTVPRLRFTPHLLSLLGGGPIVFDAFAVIGEGGRVDLTGSAPLAALLQLVKGADSRDVEGEGARRGVLQLDGSLSKVNAASLAALLFPGDASPDAHLQKGLLGGTLNLTKPLYASGVAGRKHGVADWQLEDSEWFIATSSGGRILNVPRFPIRLAFSDTAIEVREPITFKERSGIATITGALRLPLREDGEAKWRLHVGVAEDTGLSASLAKLLRCKTPPEAATYAVEGHISAPSCQK